MFSQNFLALVPIVAATALLTSAQSQADLIITIPHVTVAPGASGFLDVLVSSDGSDSFQNYFLDFVVSSDAFQAAAPINFVNLGPEPQLEATDPYPYIFLDDSAEVMSPFAGVDSVSNFFGVELDPDDLINVIDATFTEDDRMIAMSDGDFLLARLNFVAPLNATPGNVYDVDLDFGDFADIDLLTSAFFSQPTAGSITISAAAVPEPSSIALLALGSLVWFGRRRRLRDGS